MGSSTKESLKEAFGRAAHSIAYSRPIFPVFEGVFSLWRKFRASTNSISQYAIEPAYLMRRMAEILQDGRMTKMNAVAFLCVNSNDHADSRYNPVNFLYNFIKLYSAKTWQEACEIEKIQPGTRDWQRVESIVSKVTKRMKRRSKEDINNAILEKVKIFCWARDLEIATRPSGNNRNEGYHTTIADVDLLLENHNKQAENKIRKEKKDLTALPKEEYLGLLRKARKAGNITETQCAIMLCFILHAQEERNGGVSYIKHPVEVSNLVRENGRKYFGNDDALIWKACVAALLHDGGEKTNIDLENDLKGLLPDDVIEAVKCLHKKEGETYFQYLERNAANPIAALVKLCDISHNSSDAGKKPTAKQAFVYTISANYVEYKLNHQNEHISVAEFVKRNNICSEEEFKKISEMAESDAKRRPASEFPDLLKALRNLTPVSEIFNKSKDHANPRREESFTLHP